ncbi:DUF389 domain-containing protein [Flagellimonas pelagia]|uniref:DUF389 domain-containing protein n=1 Tax=Flagellimonas pelagia TaxID=2306998 RepID=A0A3A1NKJ3_9FLAO|nr:DUF389 domain-containing protein [Allomuricauda maritima]RIV46763.1 DUF389 domain-containing protein [Allomuricauda maritima]TXJ99647.1 DUF389 domain-containing protein [Allomuricauda maritima]
MSEEQLQGAAMPDQDSGDEVKKDFKGLLGSIRKFLSELLEIRSNTDAVATKESIIADIPFKGHTSWILICSIFIASIGLNANSTAVVIGAMLISPLMGPILGMGLSLAINDIDTLRRSLKNFGVMVVLSVITAFLFFYLFPLKDDSSELLARTKPDIRDVLIAFFGGLALVIARAKKGTIASVIFGVAIATALMPPLCTVGFGLAIGKPWYAAGAMYLFTINTIFIGLATFLVIKFLRFPMVRYANSHRRRLIARIASITGILVMIPAGFTFYKVFQESLFNKQAQEFLKETIEMYQFNGAGRYVDNLTKIEYNDGKTPLIELVCMGDELIPENVVNTWRTQKNQYSRLKDADLHIIQGGKDDSEEKFNYVSELYEKNKAELLNKDEQIKMLKEEVSHLSKNAEKQIPFKEISAEARANYENLAEMGFSYQISTDFKKLDTVPVFSIKWKDGIRSPQKEADAKKMLAWLKLRLQDSTLVVKEVE